MIKTIYEEHPDTAYWTQLDRLDQAFQIGQVSSWEYMQEWERIMGEYHAQDQCEL